MEGPAERESQTYRDILSVCRHENKRAAIETGTRKPQSDTDFAKTHDLVLDVSKIEGLMGDTCSKHNWRGAGRIGHIAGYHLLEALCTLK